MRRWICCSSGLGEMRMLDGRTGGMMGGFQRARVSAMPGGKAQRALSWCWYVGWSGREFLYVNGVCVGGVYPDAYAQS